MLSTEFILVILVCVPVSFIFAAMCYPFYALLRKVVYVPLTRRKRLRKAIEKGHKVVARRAQPGEAFPHFHYSNGERKAMYLFEAKGKVYRRYLSSFQELPDEIVLFYQRKPSQAETEDNFGLRENPTWFLQYLVLVVVCAVILYLVGMNYVQGIL